MAISIASLKQIKTCYLPILMTNSVKLLGGIREFVRKIISQEIRSSYFSVI